MKWGTNHFPLHTHWNVMASSHGHHETTLLVSSFSPAIFLLSVIIVPLGFLFFVFQRRRRHDKVTKKTNRGGPRSYPVLANLPQFLANRHRFHEWMTEMLEGSPSNTVAFRRPGDVSGVITANPANIEHMLKTAFENYPKGLRFSAKLEDFLGRGIFNVDGHLWRAQRKTASFEFNTRSLRNFVVTTVRREILSRLLPVLADSAADSTVVDLQDLLERFAFDNVCQVAFNEDPACLVGRGGGCSSTGSDFAESFRDATEFSAGRFRYAVPWFWKVKKALGVGSERRLKVSIDYVHGFATKIIRQRKRDMKEAAAPATADDLLSRFVAGEESSDEYLRDIVISFILAGRETTSSAMTWFFWLLSRSPEVEEKILDEIRLAKLSKADGGIGAGDMFDYDTLREMNYLHAAITESLRLYPPVPTNTTTSVADDVLPDGTEVKKGSFMSYSSYAMGRMAAVWGEDCREFRPERWLDSGGGFRPESPFRFLAFHGGPRMCLGKEMAYIQMKAIATGVLGHFAVEVAEPGRTPEHATSLTLKMKGGLPVRMRERTGI